MGHPAPTSGGGWRAARALVTLYAQVNQQAPPAGRDTTDDAFIGDTSHAARASDHNPNDRGVVCALDITHSPRPGGFNADNFFVLLQRNRDMRLKYFIHNRLIVSSTNNPWVARPYHGSNPHTEHIHISVGRGPDGQSIRPDLYDDATAWHLDLPQQPPKGGPPGALPWSKGKAGWFSQFHGKFRW